VPRITDFCSCVYVFGCKLSLVRLCNSDFGITPVDVITIGISCAAFCFHMAHISFASSWYLLFLLLLLLLLLQVYESFASNAGRRREVWSNYYVMMAVSSITLHFVD